MESSLGQLLAMFAKNGQALEPPRSPLATGILPGAGGKAQNAAMFGLASLLMGKI